MMSRSWGEHGPAADGRELANSTVYTSLQADLPPDICETPPRGNTHPDSLPEMRGTNSKLCPHTQPVPGNEPLGQETSSSFSQERTMRKEESCSCGSEH